MSQNSQVTLESKAKKDKIFHNTKCFGAQPFRIPQFKGLLGSLALNPCVDQNLKQYSKKE